MAEDPAEDEVENLNLEEQQEDDIENITVVEPTDEWTQFRLDMAVDMYNTWSLG